MNEAEQQKVRKQLDRLLETHHFKNSRRYPALLRFIVEETLAGRGEFLKERLLGVRVFDRPADYDTAADPVVRVTIAEIRKRIAQYYHDEEHDAEMRIELLPGRYAPEFRARGVRHASVPEDAHLSPESRDIHSAAASIESPVAPAHAPADTTAITPARSLKLRRFPLWAAATLGLALAVAAFLWTRPTPLEQLWSPILSSSHTVLFCVPTDVGKKRGPVTEGVASEPPQGSPLPQTNIPGPTFLAYEALGQNVVFSDMLATGKIINILALHHRDYRLRLNQVTTLEDLRQGPAVLIGGLDNQWTMRSLAPLRFHFLGSDEDRYWISDRENPANKSWSLDLKQQFGTVTRDYAIIARLHNEQSGQPEMIVAGIGMSGTAAAGEFLGSEQRMAELKQRIGQGFKDRDFEAVLSTDVVNGIAGSPKILAISVW